MNICSINNTRGIADVQKGNIVKNDLRNKKDDNKKDNSKEKKKSFDEVLSRYIKKETN